ncbi:MAG: type I DNA topoisomerase [Minisyncoccia bacterium]
MKLVIVESPSKAKTIEKYLGDGFVVRASVGHIRDLPKTNKQAIDIAAGFVPRYVVSVGKDAVISELQSQAKKATEVILATDPDREGEAIAWHLAEVLKLKNPKRIVFHEITKDAVHDALAHPRAIDTPLREAQEARRVLDRLIGYDLSGLIWKKVRYGLSAGRVQSPSLRIIMEREREIRAFIPVDFWTISGLFTTALGVPLPAHCVEEPTTQARADEIVARGKIAAWTVASVKETEQKRAPRAPFTTSTLQQTASTRLGFSPSRTMQVAQKLYEAGFISYMRTDSTNLGAQAVEQILKEVASEYGKEYVEARVYKTKSKSAQEAHEAIRPTTMSKESAGANDEQKKLYRLIRARTLASQMSDARVMRTAITLTTEVQEVPAFVANGSRVVFDGWLKADPDARGEEVELPKVSVDGPITCTKIESEHKQTQPPNRYTEAGLIKELEKRGIGRPSTYASIMRTLAEREYVLKEGKTLKPTDTGDVVSSFVEAHFPSYISDTFTAEMEDELDEIANGTREYVKTLKEIYLPFKKDLDSKEDIPKQTSLGDVAPEIVCPVCAGPMEFKLSRNGKFMSCKKFPDCNGARKEDGNVIEPPKELDEECPQCKKHKLTEREGRFGKFVACGNYPKCKYIKRDSLANSSGVPCTHCKKGEMVERRGRFGIFFSCSNYPDCKHAIKTKPTGAFCTLCNALMMEGTKTIPERCSVKACPNHNPHKLEIKK